MEPKFTHWSFCVSFRSNDFHNSRMRREPEGFSSRHVTVPSQLVCVLCRRIPSGVVLIWIGPCSIRSGKQLLALCIVPLRSSLLFLSACVPRRWRLNDPLSPQSIPLHVLRLSSPSSTRPAPTRPASLLLLEPLTHAPNNRWRDQLCMFKTQTHPRWK